MRDSREFELKAELQDKRKAIKSFEDLTEYLKYIAENCNCGYGEAPRAIAQAALATGYYLSHDFGITGFQAGCVMWDFVRDWLYTSNKCGLKMIDYDNMLYPQYADYFEKTISEDTWYAVQSEAKRHLEEDDGYSAPRVREHWQSIVDGKVPFGFKVDKR